MISSSTCSSVSCANAEDATKKPEAGINGSATMERTLRKKTCEKYLRIHIEDPPDVEIIQQYDLAPIVVPYSTGKEKEFDAKGTGSGRCHGAASHGLHLPRCLRVAAMQQAARMAKRASGPADKAGHKYTEMTE
jgi:hypothetical protein